MINLEEAKTKLQQHNLDPNLASYLYKYLPEKKYFAEGITRLINKEPVQYIVGEVDFYGNILKINKDVLIPRFETELLVEKTINYLKNKFNKPLNIVDIGTGSGCIAISLKKALNCNMTAVDISKKALKIAKTNAQLNQVNINFLEGNLLEPLTKTYDVIISNPPYIRYDEEIQEIVKNNEPSIALYAKDNGLYYYKEILKNCSPYLNKNFLIAFEIGREQGRDITNLAHKYLSDIHISVEKDLSGNDRFIFITNKRTFL